eukprot:COSAG01_NODE_3128_length_6541_cov_14.744334_6_plen_101_part_00
MPLGYEVGGAWGPSAVNAFQEVLAVKAATTNRELTDFSIINFASHWQQAIGVSIVRGAASVVARAAPRVWAYSSEVLLPASLSSEVVHHKVVKFGPVYEV